MMNAIIIIIANRYTINTMTTGLSKLGANDNNADKPIT